MEEKTIADVWLLLGQMDAKLDRVVDDTADHSKRITALEKSKNYERGFAAAIGAVASLCISWCVKH